MTNQLEVLFHSLCSQGVLTKDQVLAVHESIDFAHRHVREKLLRDAEEERRGGVQEKMGEKMRRKRCQIVEKVEEEEDKKEERKEEGGREEGDDEEEKKGISRWWSR